MRLRRNHEASGRPVIVQHDAAGSSEIVHALAAGFIGKRPVIAVNLPGHGESDNTMGRGKVTVTGYAKALLQALDVLGIREADFIGTWGGGLVGLELARLAPKRLRHLAMADALYHDERELKSLRAHYTPDIQPVWFGGHLLEAWYFIRDQGLFWPWFNRTRQGIIRKEPYVDPHMVNARVLELFRSEGMWRQAYQAHFHYPFAQRLRAATLPMAFCAPSWDPQLEHSQRAARDFPKAPFISLPDDMGRWADALLPFFDR